MTNYISQNFTKHRYKSRSIVFLSLIFFCLPTSVSAKTLIWEADVNAARAECLAKINVDCLLTLAFSAAPPSSTPKTYDEKFSQNTILLLRRLGYMDEVNALVKVLRTSPASLLAQDKFEAAFELKMELSKNTRYEFGASARSDAVRMIVQEHFLRGDTKSAIEVISNENGTYNPDAYLARLLGDSIRKNAYDDIAKIAFSMRNKASNSPSSEGRGARDRALEKLVRSLIDRGQSQLAKEFAEIIIGLPYRCDAAAALSHYHFAIGDSKKAQDVLLRETEKLVVQGPGWLRTGQCALKLANIQIDLGAQNVAQDTVNFAAKMINTNLMRNDRRMVQDIRVVFLSQLATLQHRLGNETNAKNTLEIASALFDRIEKLHPDFQTDLWLAYATAVVRNPPNKVRSTNILSDMISIGHVYALNSSRTAIKFAKVLVKFGDLETAELLATRLEQTEKGLFNAYKVRTLILEQLALRGKVSAAQKQADSTSFKKFHYSFGQGWVARAAFATGDIERARQILRQEISMGQSPPRSVIGAQKMLGFDDDLPQSYQIYFERLAQSPPDELWRELLFLAEEIG